METWIKEKSELYKTLAEYQDGNPLEDLMTTVGCTRDDLETLYGLIFDQEDRFNYFFGDGNLFKSLKNKDLERLQRIWNDCLLPRNVMLDRAIKAPASLTAITDCDYRDPTYWIELDHLQGLEHTYNDQTKKPELIETACRFGKFEMLKWLLKKECPINWMEAAEAATEGGNLDCLKEILILNFGGVWLDPEEIMHPEIIRILHRLAARTSSRECLEYLHQIYDLDIANDYSFYHDTILAGNLEILEYLIKEYPDSMIMMILPDIACKTDQVKVLEWLHDRNFKLTSDCYESAIRSHSNECFEYLLDHDCPTGGIRVLDELKKSRNHLSR